MKRFCFREFKWMAGLLMAGSLATIPATALSSTESRLFVPAFRFGAGAETQLLIGNPGERDAVVDIWAFRNDGGLLGQSQLVVKAHGTRSMTMTEAFGARPSEESGWLAAVSTSARLEMSYTLLEDRPQTEEAGDWALRELTLRVSETDQVLTLTNPSAVRNDAVIRHRDADGVHIGMSEHVIDPFGQLDIRISEQEPRASFIDIAANGHIIATLGSPARSGVAAPPAASESVVSLVISSGAPIGAYQILLRFDPKLVEFTQDDVQGGSADGFQSKPLAIGIDNASGLLRVASFQVGSAPSGEVEVARIRVRSRRSEGVQFGMTVEEITGTTGHTSDSIRGVRLAQVP